MAPANFDGLSGIDEPLYTNIERDRMFGTGRTSMRHPTIALAMLVASTLVALPGMSAAPAAAAPAKAPQRM